MKKFLHENICIILSGIMFAIFFIPSLLLTWKDIAPSDNFLSSIIAIYIGIIGVAFPIIIGNVGKTLSTYNNQYIANIFKEERAYKRMFRILVFLGITVIVYLFYTYSKFHTTDTTRMWQKYSVTLIFFMCLYSLYAFWSFWRVFTEYIVNTDQIIIEKISGKVDSLLEHKKPTKELLDYMDMYNQVLQTKLKADSYVDLVTIVGKQTKLISGTLANLGSSIEDSNRILGSDNYLKPLFTKYYLNIYSCWKQIFREASDDTVDVLFEYHRLLKDVLGKFDENKEILKGKDFEPLFFLYQRMVNDIDKKTADTVPYAQRSPWEWYTSLCSEPELSSDLLSLLDSYLLATMKIVVKTKNSVIFESFIASIIDRLWFHDFDQYPYYGDESNIIEKIKEGLPGAIFLDEFKALQELTSSIKDVKKRAQIQAFIHERFRYNHISFTVTMLGAYCLFRSEYKYIEYILKYNQPDHSTIQFINKDIVPNDINILLKWYKNCPSFMSFFVSLWEGHNDGQLWLKKYISLLVCNLIRLDKSNLSYKKEPDSNKQTLGYDKLCISEIKRALSDNYNTDIIKAIGLSPKNRYDTINLLDKISREIEEYIKTEQQQQQLSLPKEEDFKGAIRKDVQERPIWLNLLQETLPAESPPYSFKIGDKRLIDKSFLAKNDNGIYIGFYRGFSDIIVNQINYYVEGCIRSASLANMRSINKTNFKEKILEFDKTWIVLFINYPPILDWVYDIPDFKTIFNNKLIGITGKGAHIYAFNDHANQGVRMILFQKTDISKVTIELDIKVTDLNEDNTLRNTILYEKPYWLNKYQSDNEKDEYLRTHAEIDISGNISFQIAHSNSILILENI